MTACFGTPAAEEDWRPEGRELMTREQWEAKLAEKAEARGGLPEFAGPRFEGAEALMEELDALGSYDGRRKEKNEAKAEE